MAKGTHKNIWVFVLVILVGIIIGSLLGDILKSTFDNPIFKESFTIGTQGSPAIIDLIVVKIQFGLTFIINIGTVIGILVGVFIYTRI